MNQIEYHFDLEAVHKGYKRLEKSEKIKEKLKKDTIKEMVRKRDEKIEAVKVNHGALK